MNSYAVYKEGTTCVAQAIESMAGKFGYWTENQASSSRNEPHLLQEKRKKPNGKARRPKKKPEGSKNSGINELLKMAQYIAEKGSKLEKRLPPVLKVLGGVILGRKKVAARYQAADLDEETLKSNKGHAYYIRGLEKIQEILQGALPNGTNNPKQQDAPDNETMARNLSNLYAVLDIEEPEEVGNDTPTTKAPVTPKPTKTYELENDDWESEIYFQVATFFDDFADVRNHVSTSWLSYAEGTLDLASVAISTNIAIEMVQKAEAELTASITKRVPSLNNFLSLSGLIMEVEAVSKNTTRDARVHPNDFVNLELIESMDLTCFITYKQLEYLCSTFKEIDLVRIKRSLESLDISGREFSWPERKGQEFIILTEFWQYTPLLSKDKQEFPIVDELTRGLMQMNETQKVPTWLVLATRLWLDMQQVMVKHSISLQLEIHESTMSRPLRDLRATGAHTTKTLKAWLGFTSGSPELWPREQNRVIEKEITFVDYWINEDFYQPNYLKRQVEAGVPICDQTQARPWGFLSSHPILCGLLQFYTTLRRHKNGINMNMSLKASASMAHLYNAVRQESSRHGDDFPLWKDMEEVIKMHKERIFIGDYPNNSEDYLKRLGLLEGISVTAFAANRRESKGLPFSPNGPRKPFEESELYAIFGDQYLLNGRVKGEVTRYRVEQRLGKSIFNPKNQTKGKQQKSSKKQSDKLQNTLTVRSFLDSLRDLIQSDLFALNFDWVAFLMRCFLILSKTYVHIQEKLRIYPEILDYSKVEHRKMLPFLVGDIFNLRLSWKVDMTANVPSVTSRLTLQEVAAAMKACIRSEGDKETKRVKNLCWGVGETMKN